MTVLLPTFLIQVLNSTGEQGSLTGHRFTPIVTVETLISHHVNQCLLAAVRTSRIYSSTSYLQFYRQKMICQTSVSSFDSLTRRSGAVLRKIDHRNSVGQVSLLQTRVCGYPILQDHTSQQRAVSRRSKIVLPAWVLGELSVSKTCYVQRHARATIPWARWTRPRNSKCLADDLCQGVRSANFLKNERW